MAGTPHGYVDGGGTSQANWKHDHDLFTRLYKFFSTSARHAVIAYNKGLTGGNVAAATPGTDFWDGANPFGRQAWFLVRFTNASKAFYILFEFYDGSSITPQYGGVIRGSTSITSSGVAFQCVGALDSGGAAANPFQGTMVNTGSDTRPTGVWWAPPGGGKLFMTPRSNALGGTWVTNKNNMRLLPQNSSPTSVAVNRWHFGATDDAFWMTYDAGDNGLDHFTYMGLYVPRSDVTSDMPLCMVSEYTASDAFNFNSMTNASPTIFGGATTGDPTTDGGVHGSTSMVGASSSLVYDCTVGGNLMPFVTNTNLLQNKALATASNEEWPIFIGAYESSAAFGMLGYLEQVRIVTGVNNKDTNQGKTRAYFMGSGPHAHAIPWDGVTTPGTSVGRGVAF